jgi:hypothetical protein
MLSDLAAIVGKLYSRARKAESAVQPQNVRGPGVHADSVNLTINPPPAAIRPSRPFRLRPFLVTGHTQDGSNLRWTYALAEAHLSGAGGYGTWQAITGGLTVAAAYNMNENINGTAGLTGCGVNQSNLVGTFTLIFIPNGTPVVAIALPAPSGGVKWWIYGGGVPNGVDGACP